MTPMLLMQAAKLLRPVRRKIIALSFFSLVFGLSLFAVAASLETFSRILFLFTWISLITGMFCFGLSLLTQLYSKKPEPLGDSIASKIKYYWNLAALTIAAPFFTLWIIGMAILLPAGILILLMQSDISG
ncbi:hypothetical protein [Pseudomonas sp. BMS12]|uniref:hypothetical protein n=1 Tax=Pseudomonas sp. BMS12 TaxID=1796033 RepID=UPI00129045D1|nr:hypothetical protein [Pseudomonas sp. BMS12]